jgi:predicted DNA-binding transcriptional regulator AlpA
MDTNTLVLSDDKLLRIHDVVDLTTLSRSCINLWVAQGRFPKPLSPSHTIKLWRLSDIQGWVDAQAGNTVTTAGDAK